MKQKLIKTLNEDKKIGRYEGKRKTLISLPSYPLIFVPSMLLVLLVMFLTALPALCAPITIKQTAVKFLFAMGGVALSSFLIFLGLSIYNKFFGNKNYIEQDDSLSTPDNIQDAIIFFIKKNKLK